MENIANSRMILFADNVGMILNFLYYWVSTNNRSLLPTMCNAEKIIFILDMHVLNHLLTVINNPKDIGYLRQFLILTLFL